MNAGQKWAQLFLDIVAYELDHAGDGEMLSEGADKLVARSPVWGRVFILCAGSVITCHLANMLDPKFDVLSQDFWRKTFKGRR